MTAGWTSKTPVLAAIVLSTIVLTGTVGYMLIEGWSAWDSLYMTIISLTTVGYREVHPMSRAGEAFTMVVLVGGVGTVLYTFTLIGARVIEGTLHNPWERRRIIHMLDKLENHFIVCRYGRIGSIIVEEFTRQHVPHVIIERDPERLRTLTEAGHLVVEGDASSEEVLSKAGVARARGLIAAVSTDAENVYTILSARLMQPTLYIIGRAESDESTRKIKRAGADRGRFRHTRSADCTWRNSPCAPRWSNSCNWPTSSEFLELSMEQIEVRADGPLVGQSIVGANLRQAFGVIVVGIRRASGKMEFNPSPDARMEAGDYLVLLGPNDRLSQLAAHSGGTRQTV